MNGQTFDKEITTSDVFLDMPLSVQALYFHLHMQADDEGRIHNAKAIIRMIGATADDLEELELYGFIESGQASIGNAFVLPEFS